jgi:hypothetical protein
MKKVVPFLPAVACGHCRNSECFSHGTRNRNAAELWLLCLSAPEPSLAWRHALCYVGPNVAVSTLKLETADSSESNYITFPTLLGTIIISLEDHSACRFFYASILLGSFYPAEGSDMYLKMRLNFGELHGFISQYSLYPSIWEPEILKHFNLSHMLYTRESTASGRRLTWTFWLICTVLALPWRRHIPFVHVSAWVDETASVV